MANKFDSEVEVSVAPAQKSAAHKDYIPAGEKSTSGIVNEYIGNIKKKTSGGRHNVFLPGESWPDYQVAKHKAKQAGISAERFDASRMELNGFMESL